MKSVINTNLNKENENLIIERNFDSVQNVNELINQNKNLIIDREDTNYDDQIYRLDYNLNNNCKLNFYICVFVCKIMVK